MGCKRPPTGRRRQTGKNRRFRKPLIFNHLHRVTRWDRLTCFETLGQIRDFSGPGGPLPRHAISSPRITASLANPYIRARKSQGPPTVTDGPCWTRDGLCNPS